MFARSLVAALLASSLATAITVQSPTNTTNWSSGTSAQTVSWEAVSTDPTSFVIQLVNQAGFLPNSPVTLVANQATGASNTVNSVTVTYSAGTWPVGQSFQINLISTAQNNPAILAQSLPFNIVTGGNSGSSSSNPASASVPTTMSTSTVSGGSSATVLTITSSAASGAAVGNGGDASGGIPNAVSTSAKGGASQIGVPVGLAGMVAVIAAFFA